MSAKEGAMMHLMPKSSRAQGACSRDEPQPKLGPVHTRTLARRYGSWFSTKSGLSLPSSLYRQSLNRAEPKPVRLIVLRNCLGMMASVSTLVRSMGATMPLRTVNLAKPEAPWPGADVLVCGLLSWGWSAIISRSASSSDTRSSTWAAAGAPPGAWNAATCGQAVDWASFRASASLPAMAAAAAMTGLIRWVRPPAPWRPSKLRLLVLAHRSKDDRMSGFMPRHRRRPAARRAEPAAGGGRARP